MKLSMINFFALTTIVFSTSAFAISDEALANKCLDVGKNKVAKQAEAYGCKIDLSKIEVQEIDNRFYNPSKYVWYQVIGECDGYDRVIKMVQYYKGKCF
jgi:hypothetical protein